MLAPQRRLHDLYRTDQKYGFAHHRRDRSFQAFERGTDRQKGSELRLQSFDTSQVLAKNRRDLAEGGTCHCTESLQPALTVAAGGHLRTRRQRPANLSLIVPACPTGDPLSFDPS